MAVARGLATVKTLRPTLGTSANAAGTVLFQAVEIPGAVAGGGCCAILESLTVMDMQALTTVAIDFYFFSKLPASSYGANNAAFVLTDADAVYCLGEVAVAAADFAAVGTGQTLAQKVAIGLLLSTESPLGGSNKGSSNTSIWVIGVCRAGTPTYAATDLVIKIGLLQE